jgi:hypothetical protein
VGHRPCSSHIFRTSFRSERLARVSPPPTLVSVWGSHRRQEAQPHSSTQGVTLLQSQFSPPPSPHLHAGLSTRPTPPPHSPLPAHVSSWRESRTVAVRPPNESLPTTWADPFMQGCPHPLPSPNGLGTTRVRSAMLKDAPHHDDVGHPHPYSLPRVARRCGHVRATVDSSFLVVPLCGAIHCLRRILLWRRRARLQREKTTIHMHACRHLCTAAPSPPALPKGLLGSPSARTLAVHPGHACMIA